MTKKRVSVIGAGPAGMRAASTLAAMNIEVLLFEKDEIPGGHLSQWHVLFPSLQPASDVLIPLKQNIRHNNITILTNQAIAGIKQNKNRWTITSINGKDYLSDAVLIATGFNLFNAERKEEYGYKMYPQVVTSADLEALFNGQQKWPFSSDIEQPRIGLVHCVGSRDAKCGNRYCSKVCCVTAVKQAIELKKKFPQAQIYCFYMDMRMYGPGFEELYQDAQTNYNIQFIRGRLSEASPSGDNKVQVKAEDTLMGRPVKLTLDMLVLMVGMEPASILKFNQGQYFFEKPEFGDGFITPESSPLHLSTLNNEGLYVAGACKGPASLPDVILDAEAASMKIINYLNQKS
jgi:heterodisulfide reductase subunit A